MVKGTSKQVIVVHSPDRKMFEQAIFILKDDAVGSGVTDDILMREAERAIRDGRPERKRHFYLYGAVWAAAGAVVTGIVWAVTTLVI